MILSRKMALVLVGVTAFGAVRASAQKMAYINSQLVISRAPGAAAADEALRREGEAMQNRVKLWEDSLQKLVDDYTKAEAGLPAAERDKRRKTIEDRRLDYARRADSLDGALQLRRTELTQPIWAQIRETLDAIRAEDGYSFIFDVAAGSFIVAADKNLDITEKVIGRLKPVALGVKADTTKPSGARVNPAGVGKKPPLQ